LRATSESGRTRTRWPWRMTASGPSDTQDQRRYDGFQVGEEGRQPDLAGAVGGVPTCQLRRNIQRCAVARTLVPGHERIFVARFMSGDEVSRDQHSNDRVVDERRQRREPAVSGHRACRAPRLSSVWRCRLPPGHPAGVASHAEDGRGETSVPRFRCSRSGWRADESILTYHAGAQPRQRGTCRRPARRRHRCGARAP
jgi:hypothetical protein